VSRCDRRHLVDSLHPPSPLRSDTGTRHLGSSRRCDPWTVERKRAAVGVGRGPGRGDQGEDRRLVQEGPGRAGSRRTSSSTRAAHAASPTRIEKGEQGNEPPAAGLEPLRRNPSGQQHRRGAVWIVAVQQGVRREPTLVDGADIFGAVQNLLLAARKHGIGGTLTMLHHHHEDDVARLLGLPQGAATVALIPLGYPDGVRFSTPRRRSVETVTHWERWGRQKSRDT
jgi:nitroreductase